MRFRNGFKHALLLDLDGTIVTSHFRNIDAKAEVLKLLKEVEPSNKLSLNDHIRDYFLWASRPEVSEREELRRRIAEIIDRYELESVEKCQLKEGVELLLKEFNDKVPLIIVSNSGRKAVQTTLKKFGLTDSFQMVLSRDDAPDLKPSGAGIRLVLSRFNIRNPDAVMVGDTPMDVLASSDAKVNSVALTDGVGKKEDLERVWPDYLMPGLKEVTSLLKRVWFT